MKITVHSLLLLLLVFAVIVCAGNGQTQTRESQIKAAFLYNFTQFTDWPKNKFSEPNTITLGLLGEHSFGNSFDPVKNKTVRNKRLVINDFGKFRTSFSPDNAGKIEMANYIEDLRKCHVLFVCNSEHENYKSILNAVKGYGVLTVGETDDFIDVNGIVTFVQGTDKPVFEINLKSSEREGLKISSKVLRLARRIIGNESAETVTDSNGARKP